MKHFLVLKCKFDAFKFEDFFFAKADRKYTCKFKKNVERDIEKARKTGREIIRTRMKKREERV